jgi:aspartate/methionine/tyrosine aminotransferase
MSAALSPARFQSPFQRLARLISGTKPGASQIDLAVGEPRHPIPSFVGPVLSANLDGFGRYPAIRGTDGFRRAVADWLDQRYGLAGLIDPETGVLPLNGSREGLFFAALEARDAAGAKPGRPAILMPNPLYQAYAAGAEAAGAEAVALSPAEPGSVLPDLGGLDPALLERTIAIYIASPANPQGTVMSLDDWRTLIALARRHRFMVFADECYSELYRATVAPPPGVLEAARDGLGLDCIIAFNSLSKRSNLPGLRCGFAAGDPDFLARWMRLRNTAAPQVPTPLQAIAVAAFGDERHVAENRRLYDAKYGLAREHLAARFGEVVPPAGFFLWLDVTAWGGGEATALHLWREGGLKTVPGGYLAVPGPDGRNPGEAHLRLALVDDIATTGTALDRLARLLG